MGTMGRVDGKDGWTTDLIGNLFGRLGWQDEADKNMCSIVVSCV